MSVFDDVFSTSTTILINVGPMTKSLSNTEHCVRLYKRNSLNSDLNAKLYTYIKYVTHIIYGQTHRQTTDMVAILRLRSITRQKSC